MLKAFERIQRFGVFEDYSRPADVDDFAELNLIYGWNYSGKTTLSRALRTIEQKSLHPDYADAQFKISTTGDHHITESSLFEATEQVRVFNSDFVKDNLSWEGGAFEPILLLGKESIEAQHEIRRNKLTLERLRKGSRSKESRIADMDSELREKKKAQAKSIKQTLQLVDTYTAAHLNQDLTVVRHDPNPFIVVKDELDNLLQTATADEREKLPELQPISLRNEDSRPDENLRIILAKMPEMNNTIQYLADHAEVANWIRQGLPLHTDAKQCEFCGNPISTARLEALRAHFSEDVTRLEDALNRKKTVIKNCQLDIDVPHKSNFYSSLRPAQELAHHNLLKKTAAYNDSLSELVAAIDRKLLSPFESIECPPFDAQHFQDVSDSVDELNGIIRKNNDITVSFDKEKRLSISALKRHFAADFFVTQQLDSHEAVTDIIARHKSWYEHTEARLEDRNRELEAQISQAQKGREELNAFIEKFLTGSNVSVTVVKIDDEERFRLVRDKVPAKNLSEGERTAIAYAFFLIKLKEAENLNELIVYIDDPISSLDSNHVFQIFAATKSFFFHQDPDEQDKWKLSVSQLFVSTHNFEFLGLSKELPIKERHRGHYLVKRLDTRSSTFTNMPKSIIKYGSEYQYLWSVIYDFHTSDDKSNLEKLLSLPNALRRFVELYTYSKYPSDESVGQRADKVFGSETSQRILKLLHFFSHSNNLLRISQNNDLICDVENVVDELVSIIQLDRQHFDALMSSLS